MRMRDFIDDLGLKEGERYRGNCPQCRGKNTFTATNTLGDIQYNCFKLGCTIRGIYVTDMTAAEIRRRLEDQQTQRAYTNIKKEKDTMEIPEYVVTPKASHTKYQRYVKRWGIAIGQTMYGLTDAAFWWPVTCIIPARSTPPSIISVTAVLRKSIAVSSLGRLASSRILLICNEISSLS